MSTKRTVKDWVAVVRTGIEVCGIPSKHDVERLLEAIDHAPTTITPEQQAVLDAAVAWRNQLPEYEVRNFRRVEQPLAAAVDAMTRKPSVADRLVENRHFYGQEGDREFAALIAEVRALEAGKGKEA